MSSTLFSLSDYEGLLGHFRGRIPIIGGQAVAFWVLRHAPSCQLLASQDIDFQATGDEVRSIAAGAVRELRFPNRRERTNLSAVGLCDTPAGTSPVEFLHTLPGVDVIHPEIIFLDEHTVAKTPIKILEPVSLMMSKLFAIRNFDQTDRNDIGHLRSMVPACNAYLSSLLERDPALAFLQLQRLARWMRPDAQKKAALRNEIPLMDVFPGSVNTEHPNPKIASFSREHLRRLRDEWQREAAAFPDARSGDIHGSDPNPGHRPPPPR